MMGKFESWDDLADKLRSAFQPYDYEDSLWEEIRMRTQGAQEKVIIFVSVMENLFRKLRVLPPEESRVRIIRRNMLPYIQTQMTLHTVRTVSELLNLSKSIEETAWRVQRFCPPPTNTRQLLEPELAYQEHRGAGLHLSHARGDQRPYLSIDIFGLNFLCLLDSGATRTVIGGPGWQRLEDVCTLKPSTLDHCTVANGQKCQVLGTVSLPFQLRDRIQVIDALVIPTLPHSIILGVDFWKRMEVVPNLHAGEWNFCSDISVQSAEVAGIQDNSSLTPEQRALLDSVVNEAFDKMGDRVGRTHLVEHVIRTDSPQSNRGTTPSVLPFNRLNQQVWKRAYNQSDAVKGITSGLCPSLKAHLGLAMLCPHGPMSSLTQLGEIVAFGLPKTSKHTHQTPMMMKLVNLTLTSGGSTISAGLMSLIQHNYATDTDIYF
nr:unnamed protein product [Callosobruchus analis]